MNSTPATPKPRPLWDGFHIEVTDQRDMVAARIETGEGDYAPHVIAQAYAAEGDDHPIAALHLDAPHSHPDPDALRVALISTDAAYRRRGVATELARYTREVIGCPLVHSHPDHRSTHGNAWAAIVPLDGVDGDDYDPELYDHCEYCGNREDICPC